MISVNNLYNDEKPAENREIFSTLFHNNSFRIEAIRSWLKVPGEVYNQEEDEWVLLLSGEAKLEIDSRETTLTSGDYLFIPKHTVHRVLSTSKNAHWLGIFSS
ncbi:MAG: cupin domain-containing protein [Sulfuricurvum sp.]|nr:cupin domain-containing protein [Sulfuricurvum sp.]